MAKQGFPHSRLYAFNSGSQTALSASLLDTLDLLTSDLTAVIFHIPPHKYSHSPLLAGSFTNFWPIRVKRWHPPPLRMHGEPNHFRPTVKIHQFQFSLWPVRTCYELGAFGPLGGFRLPTGAERLTPFGRSHRPLRIGWRSGPSVCLSHRNI